MISIIEHAASHGDQVAVVSDNQSYTYSTLLNASALFASKLLNGQADLQEQRVAFMVNPGLNYVATLWAIWQSGGIAVPLCLTHPLPSLQYVLEDTQATILVLSPEYKAILADYAAGQHIRLIATDEITLEGQSVPLPDVDTSRGAMILYTSGTTNKPKGVVSTHANLNAQISTLVTAWEWTAAGDTLCVLPLHHVHGIVNVVSCSMWSGATCRFIPAFSAEAIFALFLEGQLNVFMAVPTIYFKLIAYWETLPIEKQQELTACMAKFRLMVCGSAALPVTVMEKWKHISGQVLLERYGMTEIGMAISNPYHGQRKPGYVGLPLPGVQVKLADEQYADSPAGEPGEILIKGANVFKEYWRRPEATADTFTADGWFKTGDIAVVEDGYYRIMGRNSVDIIKSGGYKISALEIEEVLRTHDSVSDCAVVAIPDDEWGELIVAAIVSDEAEVNFSELNTWMRTKIAAYKTPRKYLLIAELPKNAMGKVVKNDVKKLFNEKA
jgi:malonyl-CoA/methylmalonyl-CoA synthetase